MENTAELTLHERLLATAPDAQSDSPLFNRLPAEVRTAIYSLALTDYLDPDPAKRYEANTLFTRPSYSAPRRTDTSLLRTCRAIYSEAWFLPFVLREQTHWLTREDRAPPEYDRHGLNIRNLTSIVQRYLADSDGSGGSGGDGMERLVEIDSVRVFVQMFLLEEATPLVNLITTPGLRFRRLTITIRHQDWWEWEYDRPLYIKGQKWIEKVSEVLPDTVKEVVMELESLERKKHQIDRIAEQMQERWFFKRTDGAILLAEAPSDGQDIEKTDLVTRWSGSSTWQDRRWVRDETEPGRVDYYVRTVPFKLKQQVEANGGQVSDEALKAAEAGKFDTEKLYLQLPGERPMRIRGPTYRSTIVHQRVPVGDALRRVRDLRLQRPR
jgi:hypothetical protein